MQETEEMGIGFLGWEDPQEEGMETHSSVLACRIPQTEDSGGLQSIALPTKSQPQLKRLSTHTRISDARVYFPNDYISPLG